MTDIQEIYVTQDTKQIAFNFIATPRELWRRGFYITWGVIFSVMMAIGIFLILLDCYKYVKELFL